MISRLRQSLGRNPRTATLLESLRAYTLADRADHVRSHGDIAALRIPPGPGAWRSTRIKAHRRGGRDQCVEAFHQSGWWGYERPLPDVLLRWLRERPGLMMDVGANTGVYSLIAASVPGIRVHAFEALPSIAALLRENLSLNACARQVTVVDTAISDTVGEVNLYVPENRGLIETSASLDPLFRGDEQQAVRLTVPGTTLDAYWSKVGEPPVSTIKIDVEGVEHLVLRGANRILSQARPVAFYEVLPNAHLAALEHIRSQHRYVDVRLSPWEAVVNDRIQFHELAWNHALVPFENVDRFVSATASVGLKTTLLN